MYFLGVIMHTTVWDQLWGGDKTLKYWFEIELGIMIMMKLGSLMGCRLQNAGYLCLAQHFSGIGVNLNVFLSPLKYI